MCAKLYSVALALALALGASVARADTLGYLRVTPIAAEFTIAKAKGASRVVVARTPTEWTAAWRAAGGKGDAARVDFERHMIVGVVNDAKTDRVVYRIQLDDAAHAKALEVHLGFGDAPTWSGSTRKATGAHFVVTPRSALAVHFVMDDMVDGRMFAATNTGEGVESEDVATIAAVAGKTTGKAALRGDAERAVVASLSAAERKQLLVGPLGAPLARIPHGWTKLAVTRDEDRWSIAYDDMAFEVDVATGRVTRRP
jgi:hypothetical protein